MCTKLASIYGMFLKGTAGAFQLVKSLIIESDSEIVNYCRALWLKNLKSFNLHLNCEKFVLLLDIMVVLRQCSLFLTLSLFSCSEIGMLQNELFGVSEFFSRFLAVEFCSTNFC